MWTLLSALAVYGMGAGLTYALGEHVLDYFDEFGIALAVLWPIGLPGLIMWKVASVYLGDDDGE